MNIYDVDEKSKEFLKKIMGKEKFDILQKDGKLDIEVNNKKGKIIYELYKDGRVINRTKNQSYCLVADRSDYPNDDMVAIKYAWLTHKSDVAEKVANKTNLYTGITERFNNTPIPVGYRDFIRDMEERGWERQQINITNNDDNNLNATTTPWYGDYVDYLTSHGWRRELITIDQNNTSLAITRSINRDTTGTIVDIRCPAGMKMSIMGTQQIPRGADANMAYSLGLYIIDNNGEEILDHNKIRISKVKPSAEIIQLARLLYQDIKITQDREPSYRFRQGIELNGETHIMIDIVNSQNNIYHENVKFKMEADIWAH